jgi:hypothetical protein
MRATCALIVLTEVLRSNISSQTEFLQAGSFLVRPVVWIWRRRSDLRRMAPLYVPAAPVALAKNASKARRALTKTRRRRSLKSIW